MEMKRFINDMEKYYRYAVYSAKAELKAEVAGSYLNWIWWILEPFCMMLIYAFIFGFVFDAREKYFTAFIYGDTQKASKPKPDIFWNAAKAIGRDPKECLVVEDSTPGVMAGIAAGGETIYIHDMVDVPEEVLEHASASLEDLGQIIEWLEIVK